MTRPREGQATGLEIIGLFNQLWRQRENVSAPCWTNASQTSRGGQPRARGRHEGRRRRGNPASCQADALHSSREGQPPSPTHLFASLHCRPTTFNPAPRHPTAPPPPGKQQPLIGRSAGKAGAYKGNHRMVPRPLQQPQSSHSEMDNWDDQPPLVPSCLRAPHVEESSLWDFFYGDRDDLFPSWTIPAAHATAKACVGAHAPSSTFASAAVSTEAACVHSHVNI
ncbi:uncharacterized protein LOC118560216 [Fundulus heteroclitus]|uniref:uncharacterized protein LOC118560216 n=1 Tax=Fundulus heteroclitus TaxID=8078 RepID=UPI00165B4B4A|nr:uncharacterized protein LOC118560216 [Fundulus heteroclitus]